MIVSYLLSVGIRARVLDGKIEYNVNNVDDAYIEKNVMPLGVNVELQKRGTRRNSLSNRGIVVKDGVVTKESKCCSVM